MMRFIPIRTKETKGKWHITKIYFEKEKYNKALPTNTQLKENDFFKKRLK